MHLKLERAMYVKLIISSLSPTPNFPQKIKKTILLDFSCINRLVEMVVVYVLLHCQYLQLLNLIRHYYMGGIYYGRKTENSPCLFRNRKVLFLENINIKCLLNKC